MKLIDYQYLNKYKIYELLNRCKTSLAFKWEDCIDTAHVLDYRLFQESFFEYHEVIKWTCQFIWYMKTENYQYLPGIYLRIFIYKCQLENYVAKYM